jgi:hypothetical protein
MSLEDYWKEVRVGDKGEYQGYTGQVKEKIEGPPHKIVMEAITDERAKYYKWNQQIGNKKIDPSEIKVLEHRYGLGGKRKTRGRKTRSRKHKRKTRKH